MWKYMHCQVKLQNSKVSKVAGQKKGTKAAETKKNRNHPMHKAMHDHFCHNVGARHSNGNQTIHTHTIKTVFNIYFNRVNYTALVCGCCYLNLKFRNHISMVQSVSWPFLTTVATTTTTYVHSYAQLSALVLHQYFIIHLGLCLLLFGFRDA